MKTPLQYLRHLARSLFPGAAPAVWSMREALLDLNRAAIKADIRARHPQALVLHGHKAYSQCDEDGIIARIFELIGARSRVFVEAGCGDGIENNTHHLLIQGWRGAWIDGSARNIDSICAQLDYRPNPILSVTQAFITAENVNDVVAAALRPIGVDAVPAEIDFLSLDIDGNELHVWNALQALRPRVLCVEYNARFAPPTEVSIGYAPQHQYAGDDYQGASLQSLVKAAEPRGYRLVACNISGVNAFFVRETDLPRHDWPAISEIYMPPRYYLNVARPAFPGSLKFARDRLREAAR